MATKLEKLQQELIAGYKREIKIHEQKSKLADRLIALLEEKIEMLELPLPNLGPAITTDTVFIPQDTVTIPGGPMPTITPFIDYTKCLNTHFGGPCDFPSPWYSTSPPHCKNCGRQGQNLTVTCATNAGNVFDLQDGKELINK